jgi:hypothetical protein
MRWLAGFILAQKLARYLRLAPSSIHLVPVVLPTRLLTKSSAAS